jgi:hypothetical protein
MAKLNPYAKTLKLVRKKELADRLAAKKLSIEKAKKLHKTQKSRKAKKSPEKK